MTLKVSKNTKKEELSLETVLLNCRVALRGYGSSEKNRDAVIGLVFLKFAGEKFEARRKEILAEQPDIPLLMEMPASYNAKNVYYLKENARWDYIVKNAASNDIAVILDTAMKDIEEDNESLRGALPQNLYATLGASSSKLKSLIDEINKINKDRFHEDDLIGRVYEYFLQIYAASGTKEDGEFYTPASVVKLIAELIEPYDGVVYDPCCGSGGMFVQSMKFIDRHQGNRQKVSIIGQESVPDTRKLCKMNLSIRGIAHDLGDRNASTFQNDLFKNRKVDYIMANPPFNLKNWRDEDELLDDPRFDGYPMPPVANANYAWILHMISKLDETDGIAGFLLANGALNAGGDEGKIRKEILEKDLVEAIIVLPRDMFYTTDISVTLWIINKNKKSKLADNRTLRDRQNQVLFMDLRTWNKNIETINLDKGKKKRKVAFTDHDIKKVREIYQAWQSEDAYYTDIAELCKSVTLDDIRKEDYSLTPSKYIDFIDHDLDIDYEKEMARIQEEMQEVLKKEKESQKMLEEAFRGIGYDLD
ncbi:type I restriction-modification system subunit M [Anaerococcus sp. NML200574]|uniref:type I restriction-modification system subunit M n=1 Tax=Anaerococcus sp. NML200574 TaxID=2954486 RepID=UPI002238901D|nr:type I restriction-modification system subunit M [Anaerococcus sp. NML200574]MCW6678289.1 type I restriction-modification system subunit M [Anaerococcus sp. NML200574]